MHSDDFIMEDCKASWRENARGLAIQDAKDAGLNVSDINESTRDFIEERTAIHYAVFEKIGLDGIK